MLFIMLAYEETKKTQLSSFNKDHLLGGRKIKNPYSSSAQNGFPVVVSHNCRVLFHFCVW